MEGEDLILNGEIILEGTVLPHEWCMWMEGSAFSARMVREALAQFPGDVTVRVNSNGGDPFEGEAVRVAFAAHPGTVRVVVGGVAASAASLMIMAADRIEVSAGSFIMIHDPSGGTFGTAIEHRREADRLDILSDTYAAVYAARSGQSRDAVRQMMLDETWLGAEAAVSAGFADALVGEARADTAPPDLVAAQAMFAETVRNVRMCAQRVTAPEEPGAGQAGTAGQQPARGAVTLEVQMEPEDVIPAVATPAPATPPAPAPSPATTMAVNPDDIRRQAVEQERARQRGIREMAAPFVTSAQLTEAQVQAVIDDGTSVEMASRRFLTVMAAHEPPVVPADRATAPRARITRDETDTRLEGLVQAMLRDYSGPGEQFRGIRIRGLAMELGGAGGYSDIARAQRGMRSVSMMGGAHGVSDFAYITTEVMNRSLIAEYDRRGAGWNIVTGAPQQASDFRELHAVRFGGDFQFKTVLENGEYQEATLADQAEGLKVERRGRTISLTFEAVINDDMSAFNRIPREFAMASRVMESSMVWSILRSNGTLKSDGKALFHADHGNLAAAGAAISVTSVGAARNAMWQQRAYGTKDADDFLMVEANQLIVPSALETVAKQFVSGITPAKTTDVNPYTNTLTVYPIPHLNAIAGGSDTAWYLVSSDLPPVSVAYLDGYEAPTVQTIEGMNPDKVTMNARHIFGAAASEFRGSYKNPGA